MLFSFWVHFDVVVVRRKSLVRESLQLVFFSEIKTFDIRGKCINIGASTMCKNIFTPCLITSSHVYRFAWLILGVPLNSHLCDSVHFFGVLVCLCAFSNIIENRKE